MHTFQPLYSISKIKLASFSIDVLRLDQVHPVISGNKWFKLKKYLEEARTSGKKRIITFGGAYSNHIVATAAAAKKFGFQSLGIIRGEEPAVHSHTLKAAREFGMMLLFSSRKAYENKKLSPELVNDPQAIIIPEGGYGIEGMLGASSILSSIKTEKYSHIFVAVGTGTTLAGLVMAASSKQEVAGISVLKNYTEHEAEINRLLPAVKHNSFKIFSDYHFGGYAKRSTELFAFMNQVYETTTIPTDFVYTAKTFYAVDNLARQRYFSPGDEILIVHTGGLQGNLSLPKGTLIFG